ncbi:cytochrome P450 2U1-like [Elysia marginata]|uniref:Cytochrome P450 2U1-like n=1 Tax=Elysia marginata TaxID=1093978 RepID=A0AAV4JC89_9GAST|nr:cytochrome P450 2U1-like [Elysia marginata]
MAEQLSVTTKVIVAVIVIVVVTRWITRKRYKLPPGPRSLPLLGNILDFKGASVVDKFDEWTKTYGPVVTCYLGPKRLIIVNDFDVMYEVFTRKGSDFSTKLSTYSIELVTDGFKSIFGAPYGDMLNYQRKITSRAIRQYLTGDQLEQRVYETLQPIIENMKQESAAFNPHRYLSLAGVDTSRHTLDWLFLVLVAYPDVQKKMQEEIDRVVGDAVPGKEHRSKLVYNEAVLMETMRLYYVAPFAVPRVVQRDTTVGGYEIPAKSLLLTNNLTMMRDPKFWPEPFEFRPERFISSNEDGTEIKLASYRHEGWAPFQIGHRNCIGESLAKLELVYVITGLLQKLTFSFARMEDGETPCFDYGTSGFATMTPKPYYVKVTSRS